MNLERLHILYEHLMHGELGHKKFYFGEYNDNAEPYECGTAGCGIGECPIIWYEWSFNGIGMPTFNDMNARYSGMKWFGLRYNEYGHLFLPLSQMVIYYGGIHLTSGSTRYEVASNIKAFIDKCYIPEVV